MNNRFALAVKCFALAGFWPGLMVIGCMTWFLTRDGAETIPSLVEVEVISEDYFGNTRVRTPDNQIVTIKGLPFGIVDNELKGKIFIVRTDRLEGWDPFTTEELEEMVEWQHLRKMIGEPPPIKLDKEETPVTKVDKVWGLNHPEHLTANKLRKMFADHSDMRKKILILEEEREKFQKEKERWGKERDQWMDRFERKHGDPRKLEPRSPIVPLEHEAQEAILHRQPGYVPYTFDTLRQQRVVAQQNFFQRRFFIRGR